MRRLGLLICLALGVSCSKRETAVQAPTEPAAAAPFVGDVSPTPKSSDRDMPQRRPAVAAWFRGARMIPAGFDIFFALDVSSVQASPLWMLVRKTATEQLSVLKTLQGCDFQPDDFVAVAGGFTMPQTGKATGIMAIEGRDFGTDARLACMTDANPDFERRVIRGRPAVVDKGSEVTAIVVSPDLVVIASGIHVPQALDTIDLKTPPAIETELQLELTRVSPRSALWISLQQNLTTGPASTPGMPMPRHVSVVGTLFAGAELQAVLEMASATEAEQLAEQIRQLLPVLGSIGVPEGVRDRSTVLVAGLEVVLQIRMTEQELVELTEKVPGTIAPAPVIP